MIILYITFYTAIFLGNDIFILTSHFHRKTKKNKINRYKKFQKTLYCFKISRSGTVQKSHYIKNTNLIKLKKSKKLMICKFLVQDFKTEECTVNCYQFITRGGHLDIKVI